MPSFFYNLKNIAKKIFKGNYSTILEISAISCTFIASWFLLRDIFDLTPQYILAISTTRITFNEHMITSMASQVANYKIGFLFLVLSFILQITKTFISIDNINKRVVISIIALILLATLALNLIVAKHIKNDMVQKINSLIEKKYK
jgi:hypothetical protein